MDFGRGANIHTDNSDAFNRSLSIIGVVMFGFPGYLMLRNGWIIATKAQQCVGSSTREILSQ